VVHVIDKNLKLLHLLGLKVPAKEFPLVFDPAVREKVKTIITNYGVNSSQPLLVANIGAAWPTKRWPVNHWIDYLRKITKTGRFFPLLLWGTAEERQEAEEIARQTGVPLLPYLSIKEVMVLIDLAHLIVSGDTFALQVAAALAKPTLGLFGPTDPNRNGPWHILSRVAVTPLDCRNCYARRCRNSTCMAAISPEKVWQLTQELVEMNG
jgi:heptosyltransferase-1